MTFDEQRQEILTHTYPGWHIVHITSRGHWYARRTTPLSRTHRRHGAVESFVRVTYQEFLAALDRQALIIQRSGGYSYLRH